MKALRRRLAVLLIFSTTLYALTGFVALPREHASAASTVLLEADFEGGVIPPGFTVSPSPSTANNFADVRTDPKNGANKALYLNDTNSAAATDFTSITGAFAPQTSGQLTIEADFMSPNGVNSSAKVIRLLASDGTVAANIETKSGSLLSYRRQASGIYDDLQGYVKDTWYKIKIVADLDTKKADVYVDGVNKLTQIPFDNPVTNIAKFDSVTPGSTSRSHFLDNIKVYKSDSGGPVIPAKPASLTAAAQDRSVALSWESVTGATYYTVKAGTSSGIYTSQVKITDATVTSYTYGGLTNGTRYYFTVSASNAAGESANAAEVSAIPAAAPAKPAITGVQSGNGQVSLSWSAVPNANSYMVKYSTTPGGPYVNAGVNVAGTGYAVGSLTNGVNYYFVVSAVIGATEGPNSDEVFAAPAGAVSLGAPQNLRVPAMAFDEKSIILAWEKPESYANIADYNIYQDGRLIGSANANNTAYSPAKPWIDKFYAEQDPDNKYVKVAMHNYTVTGLAANTSYTFTVKAVDANGNESSASNSVTQSTTPVPAVFNIADYGAVGDGITLNTKAIQAAIDAATPGAKVLVPAGKFKTGAIWLKSDMTFELGMGSTLLGSDDPADYPFEYMLYDYTTVPRFYSLINAHTYDYGSLRNIRIVGEGTIDGNGWKPPTRTDDGYFPVQTGSSSSNYNTTGILAKNQTNYARDTLHLDEKGAYAARSNLITIRGAQNVFYGGFTALNPSNHTLVNLNSNQVTVAGVKLLTFDDNNADGIEFGGGEGLTVFNTIFDTGDDCMNFAAGQGAQGQKEEPTRNAWIFNNYFREGHGAVVAGSHTAAWIEHILAEDNVMFHTDVGLRAKTNTPTGGGARHIVFRDNAMKDVTNQAFIFTSSYSDANSAIEYEPAATPAQFKDIVVKNVTVDKTGSDSINVAGVDGGFHENIQFENVKFFNVTKQANISYMKNSSFKDVVYVGLASPWKIVNSTGLTFSGTTTTDSVYLDASQPPAWPNGSLTASNVTENSVKLDWTAASDNVKVTGYRIFEGDRLAGSTTSPTTTFTVTGLSPAISYTFRVEAYDATGNWSAGPSITATTAGSKDTVPPVAPAGNSIKLADNTDINTTWLNISWTPATDNVGVKSYVIYANGVKKGVVAAPGTAFNATGLQFATEYGFEVEAVDGAGNATRYPYVYKVTTAKAYDTGAPKWAPGSAITASELSSNSVKLSWPAAADDLGVRGYRIYANGKPLQGDVAFTPVNSANTVTATTYTVTNLTPNTSYTFRVEAGDVVNKWTGTGPSVSVITLAADAGGTPVTTLDGTASVKIGQPFSLTYGLSHVSPKEADAIYAQDMTIRFDPSLVEFVSADSVKAGMAIVQVRQDTPGYVRIIMASQGTAGAVTADGSLLTLNWKSKAFAYSTETILAVSQADLANREGIVSHAGGAAHTIRLVGTNSDALQAAIALAESTYSTAVEGTRVGHYPSGSKAVLKAAIDAAKAVLNDATATQEQLDQAASVLNQALAAFKALQLAPVQGDVNGDRIVNIGDLGIMAAAYGLNSGSPNWAEVKSLDFNNDGKIDIVDLVFVASAMNP